MFCLCRACSVSADIGSELTELVVLDRSRVSTFTPRLENNRALLAVALRLSGPDNLPGSAAIQVTLHAIVITL